MEERNPDLNDIHIYVKPFDKIELINPILSIYWGFDDTTKKLGSAKLRVEKGEVIADLYFDVPIEDYLFAYPYAGGIVHSERKVAVNKICLSHKQPDNGSIGRLRDQINP